MSSRRLSDAERLQQYVQQVGWVDGIPEGHFAIVDPFEPERVTTWRVKAGKLIAWPKEARNGPRARRADIPADPAAQKAFWEAHAAVRGRYLADVRAVLRGDPAQAAARYAAVTFRCASCNRALKVPESNGYGIGPECRAWMPPDLLAECARQASIVRASVPASRG